MRKKDACGFLQSVRFRISAAYTAYYFVNEALQTTGVRLWLFTGALLMSALHNFSFRVETLSISDAARMRKKDACGFLQSVRFRISAAYTAYYFVNEALQAAGVRLWLFTGALLMSALDNFSFRVETLSIYYLQIMHSTDFLQVLS